MKNRVYERFLNTPPTSDSQNVLSEPYWHGYKNGIERKPLWIRPNSSQHAAWLAGVHNRKRDDKHKSSPAAT